MVQYVAGERRQAFTSEAARLESGGTFSAVAAKRWRAAQGK